MINILERLERTEKLLCDCQEKIALIRHDLFDAKLYIMQLQQENNELNGRPDPTADMEPDTPLSAAEVQF